MSVRSSALRGAGAFALLCASLALNACGDGNDSNVSQAGSAGERIRDFGSEITGKRAKSAKPAVRGYLAARAAGEWKTACSYLTERNRRFLATVASGSKQIAGSNCGEILASLTRRQLSRSERADLAEIEIETVRVERNRGYVFYRDVTGASFAMAIEREGGRWDVADRNGRPLNG